MAASIQQLPRHYWRQYPHQIPPTWLRARWQAHSTPYLRVQILILTFITTSIRKRWIKKFGDATGLGINLQKSTVAAIHCQGLNLDEILGSFSEPKSGLSYNLSWHSNCAGPAALSASSGSAWQAISKLSGCQCKLLNPRGRRVLVCSVLSSLLVYLLTIIKPPRQFLKAFDKVCRHFLWVGNQQLHWEKCKVSWARLQRPINRGGLGITDLAAFSRALHIRWLWFQWKYPDHPWFGMELSVHELDLALFATETNVTVNNGRMDEGRGYHSISKVL
jgi:hypothetical protein